MDKKKKRGVKDWPKKHAKYITEFKVMVDKLDWEHQHGGVQEDERPHDAAAFDVYLSWLTPRTRVKLLPQAFTSDDIRNTSNPRVLTWPSCRTIRRLGSTVSVRS